MAHHHHVARHHDLLRHHHVPPPRGPLRWRRSYEWVPARLRLPLVAALVGALLGASAVAWRTDSLPLLGDDRACWDSLSSGEVADLAGDGAQAEELAPESTEWGLQGACRIVSADGDHDDVEVRVHRISSLGRNPGEDSEGWLEEFLSSDMAWLGGGLTGMASPGKAWLALPETCLGHDQLEGPLVVDVSVTPRRAHSYARESDAAARDLMARVVTRMANGTMDVLGCRGSLPVPDDLPALPTTEDLEPDQLCGLPGLTLPAPAREGLSIERVSGGEGPIRVCAVGRPQGDEFDFRLTTIEYPAFTDPLYDLGWGRGDAFGGPTTTTTGVISPAFAVAHAECQTGRVIFIVQQIGFPSSDSDAVTRGLLPGYVAAEAERIGCDPLEVDLPG
jgi:hypothetical protein